VLLWGWFGDGSPAPQIASSAEWKEPLNGLAGQGHPVYATYSLLLALGLGTMGLPHVLVRFYTNPDGRAARRTTLTVVALLGVFYLFPPLYGVLGRVYLPSLPAGAAADSLVLRLPGEMLPGGMGELLSAVLAGGAFAAFLSTASGLTISVAGVIEQDLLRGRLSRVTGDDATVVQGFRLAALLAIVVPYAASRLIEPVGLATMVSLAFAVAASTFCPLLVLGAWWRRLSTVGAAAGLLVGGTLATLAVGVTVLAGPLDGWPGALLGQPAAWTIPAAFATAIVVSIATPGRVPRHTARTMVRLHTPEDLALDRS
jgi:cation/acetate symporter